MKKLKAAIILTAILTAAILIAFMIISGGAFLFDGYARLINRIFDTDFSKSEIAFATLGVFVMSGIIGFSIWFYRHVNRMLDAMK